MVLNLLLRSMEVSSLVSATPFITDFISHRSGSPFAYVAPATTDMSWSFVLTSFPQLLRSPIFHRMVGRVHQKVQHIRYGVPPEEQGGTKLEGQGMFNANIWWIAHPMLITWLDFKYKKFLSHFTEELKDQIKGNTRNKLWYPGACLIRTPMIPTLNMIFAFFSLQKYWLVIAFRLLIVDVGYTAGCTFTLHGLHLLYHPQSEFHINSWLASSTVSSFLFVQLGWDSITGAYIRFEIGPNIRSSGGVE